MAEIFRFPNLGTNLVEAEIVEWLVQVGEEVALDGPLVEVETEKSLTEIPSPFAGVVLHHGAAVGERIRVGDVLVVIGEPGESWAPDVAEPRVPPVALPDRPRAAPAVRRFAVERGVDLSTVVGRGPGGAITRADVEARAAAVAPEVAERVRLTGVRRTVAERLQRSWREIPHFHTHDELDATVLMEVRAELSRSLEAHVPLEALAIRCLVPALRELPEFNASVEGEDLLLWRRHNVGIAVDAPDGLVVPVVHDAGELELPALCGRVTELITGARERSLQPEELAGATFTLSNVGALAHGGSTAGTPLVPPGTTAILSLGRAERRPVVHGDDIVIAPVMPLDLGCDHRAIDGGLNRRFVGRVKQLLTDREWLARGQSAMSQREGGLL